MLSAIGAAVARFPDTEEVTGSIPVSRTDKTRLVIQPGFVLKLFEVPLKFSGSNIDGA